MCHFMTRTYLFSILLLYFFAVFDDSVEFYVDIVMAFKVVMAFEVVTWEFFGCFVQKSKMEQFSIIGIFCI